MPEVIPAGVSESTTSEDYETPTGLLLSAACEDDDTESVISMSTEGSFIDIEGITTATGTVASEDQHEREEFDFVDESEEETETADEFDV